MRSRSKLIILEIGVDNQLLHDSAGSGMVRGLRNVSRTAEKKGWKRSISWLAVNNILSEEWKSVRQLCVLHSVLPCLTYQNSVVQHFLCESWEIHVVSP